MKISRSWLQTFFKDPLPDTAALVDALTFHAFEIESVEKKDAAFAKGSGEPMDEIFDVKVTPNRGHDCLCHRGIAKELSAILNVPLSHDPYSAEILNQSFTMDMPVSATIEDPKKCPRYMAWSIKGVKVGESPEWLRTALESVGQRPINNVVDAANYVMLNLGQPLHAFDAAKLKVQSGTHAIGVRNAKKGEKVRTLDDKEYELADSMLVITDAHADTPIAIAGIKGGKAAEVLTSTTDIIIESAHFDGVSIRKTSQQLKLRTDASVRYEQVISPELAAYGMRAVAALILEIAGGELGGFADVYPEPARSVSVGVSLLYVSKILGIPLKDTTVAGVFQRLGFPFTQDGTEFTVTPPFERLDITIPEDLVEEVGRIVGYDTVPAEELSPVTTKPVINKNFYWGERIREYLIGRGFSEIITSVFVEEGEHAVLNKVESDTPHLRTMLIPNMIEALEMNVRNKDLLGLLDIQLFEIGIVFKKDSEEMHLAIGIRGSKNAPEATHVLMDMCAEFGVAKPIDITEENVVEIDLGEFVATLPESKAYESFPTSKALRYQSFSKYPFIVRDIALFAPADAKSENILEMIKKEAGSLLTRSAQFDRFEKEGKVSYAYRLVFQSSEKTLTDVEVNAAMEKIVTALKTTGFEIR